MKKIIFILAISTLLSCSSNNCSEEQQSINDYYDKQIQYVKNNPFAGQIDYRQIGLLEDERDKKLSEACN